MSMRKESDHRVALGLTGVSGFDFRYRHNTGTYRCKLIPCITVMVVEIISNVGSSPIVPTKYGHVAQLVEQTAVNR